MGSCVFNFVVEKSCLINYSDCSDAGRLALKLVRQCS